MTVVISGADFNKEEQVKAASINYKNNTGAAGSKTGGIGGISSAKVFEQAVVSKGNESRTSIDVTYKTLLSEAEDVKQQIMQSASNAKDNLKALCMKLSGAEAVKIDEDGFNLADADSEECVNIIEKIRIELAMHCEDYRPMGTAIDSEKILQVAGSAGMANEVANRMDNTITEAAGALETAGKLTPMSEEVKYYMVDNKISPTIDGIYQAEHAVNSAAAGKAQQAGKYLPEQVEKIWEGLKEQIEDVIKEAGLLVDEQNINNARGFLEADIPVTKENLIYKAQLDKINLEDMEFADRQKEILDKIFDNMLVGNDAGATVLTEEIPIIKQVADVIDVLDKSDITTIEKVLKNQAPEEKTFTIQQLKDVLHMKQDTLGNEEFKQNQEKLQSHYTALMETRILMTAQAGVFLAKQGINLYTSSVYELAQQLKEYEQMEPLYSDGLYSGQSKAVQYNSVETGMTSAADYARVLAVRCAVYQVEQAPEEVIGRVFAEAYKGRGAGLTVAAFAQSGGSLKQQYDRAGQTYEAVGTQVRKDLGDSMGKAVENSTDPILSALNMENNEKNRAAVRILAANAMEMTEENINHIKEVHEILKNLINNMKPETVLSMIRENINPLNDDISKVNEYLLQKNSESEDRISEKYSRFLYKLDRTEGITPEERRQFIGIYKMMNIFTKDAGKAIGALVKQGADITMGNLMAAYESRRAYGMNVSLDENSPMTLTNGAESFYRSLFANTGGKVTPAALVLAKARQPIERLSVEGFCETVEENYNPDTEAAALEGYIEEMKKTLEANARVIRQLESAGQAVSVNNIRAAEQLLSSGIFPRINGKKVMDGIEKIGHEEQLHEMYEELADESDRELKEVLKSEDNQTYADIEQARLSNHTIGFIKNLAMRQDYYVPIDAGENTAVIHFTLVQDEDNQGRISVEMKQEDIGNISLEAKVSDNKADMFVVQDKESKSQKTVSELNLRLGVVETMFKDIFGMEAVNIYQAEADRMPERYYENQGQMTATKQLYEMAQVIVKALAQRR
ncbi:MAG: DUF6240 domain-containing protein [Eubacteriales bacterium]|nr:DUF6240 domain-containing protein [Eubacteriales bacterium]